MVSPTPYGSCADIESIEKICHDRGKPLIVDEAWVHSCPSTPSSIKYLRSGVDAGMVLPDPGDASLKTIRVVRE